MENELIIDGQVIDLSETQENAEETIIQTESSLRMKARMTTVKRWQLSLKKPKRHQKITPCVLVMKKFSLTLTMMITLTGNLRRNGWKIFAKASKKHRKKTVSCAASLRKHYKPAEHQQPQPDAIPPKPTLESLIMTNRRLNRHWLIGMRKKAVSNSSSNKNYVSLTGIPAAFPAKGRSA